VDKNCDASVIEACYVVSFFFQVSLFPLIILYYHSSQQDTMNTATADNSMTSVDDKIAKVKAQIRQTKIQRQQARDAFTENQAAHAEHQYYFLQELDKFQRQTKKIIASAATTKISSSWWCLPMYTNVVHNLSSFDESSFIIVREAALCQALHQVEIQTNQLRIMVNHHDSLVESMEICLENQDRIGRKTGTTLQRNIDLVSTDMTSLVDLKEAILEKYRRRMENLLQGEKYYCIEQQDDPDTPLSLCSQYQQKSENNYPKKMSMGKVIVRLTSLFRVHQIAEAA